MDYYKKYFENISQHSLHDTLFEKTVWARKVSHIILEVVNKKNRVTLLMISSYPHNYKSKNYAIYYEFDSHQQARSKFNRLNFLLKNNGVFRVKIKGSQIIEEKLLYK